MARPKNRPQRPGQTQATPPPGMGGAGRNRNRNRNKTKNKKPKNPAASAPPEEDPNAPPADGMGTSQLANFVRDNPEDYVNSLFAKAGMPVGGDTAFGQWLASNAYSDLDSEYANALIANPNLNRLDFMTQKYGPSSAITASNTPMGVGNPIGGTPPINTGNPYTSSSGSGLVSSTTAAQAVGPMASFQDWRQMMDINKPKGGFNKGRKARLQEQYNAYNAQANQPTGGISGTTGASGPPTNDINEWRKKFLSLAPEVRGESAMGVINTPARWSAWG